MKPEAFFYRLPPFVAGLFALMLFAPLVFAEEDASQPVATQDSAYDSIGVLTQALQLVRQDYVDEKKVNYRDLVYSAMKGMLSSLDPHSQFMEPNDFKDMQDDTRSQFGGVGIVVTVQDGMLTVVSPMEGMPGFKAGILPGDQIVKINGNSTEKMDINEAVQQLRGEPGQKVTLTVMRPTTKEIKDYVLERTIIKVDSVKDAKLVPQELAGDFKVGYVRITQFSEPTADELGEQLKKLEAQGMQALVLDLRYNPGGLLNSAVGVCAHFLPPNEMVVYTEGRTPSQKRIYRTPANSKQRPYYPLAILVNGGSASGAEIVAGALKDLNRAVLVGETTFGKGSVQSVIQLSDGSALRLTTAKYYTPSKTVIHEHGVTPTIRATISPAEERQLLARWREESGEDDGGPDAPMNFNDSQLSRAVDALKGLLIHARKETHGAPKQAGSAPAKNTPVL
jgi:carboxyl-terminal processing protease